MENRLISSGKRSNRNSNIEILRIISMVLIVAHHYAIHGFSMPNLPVIKNKVVVEFLFAGGKLGVNCFILISAYFLVNRKFSGKRLLKTTGAAWFYSVACLILFLTVFEPLFPIDGREIFKSFFPVIYSKYWFVTDYVGLMLISPILNFLIGKMGKRDYQIFLGITLGMTVLLAGTINESLNDWKSNLLWFIILYMVAGYIKLYADLNIKNSKQHFLMACLFFGALLALTLFNNYIGAHFSNKRMLYINTFYMSMNSIFIFPVSVSLFLGFLKLESRSVRWINILAGASFGVYLIHDNQLLRPYLWKVLFKNSEFYSSPYLILHAFGAIVTVYIACTVIELIRQNTVEKLYFRFLDAYYEKIKQKITPLFKSFSSKLRYSVKRFYQAKN